MDNKLATITNLFEGKEIRSIWDAEKEEYYFSVVDVIFALTDSLNPRDYWYKLKIRMTEEEKSEVSTKCRQLKMKAQDGKMRETDTLDTKGIFRLIESIPSPKAEPFKMWLAQLGSERIDEVFDPEIAIKRAIDYYRKKGYDDKWIENRIKATLDRNKLTDVWKDRGITEDFEYGILTIIRRVSVDNFYLMNSKIIIQKLKEDYYEQKTCSFFQRNRYDRGCSKKACKSGRW